MTRRLEAEALDKQQIETLEVLLQGEAKPELPGPIVEMLSDILREMKEGHSIVMMAEDESLTTQTAADFLGVSRQHLVNLLERGEIIFHRVGTHRRVYLRDLKKYADRRDAARHETLDELSRKVINAGKYEASYRGDDSGG